MVSDATRGANMPVGAAVAANCASMLGEGKPHASDDKEQNPPHDQTVTAELEKTSDGLRLRRPRYAAWIILYMAWIILYAVWILLPTSRPWG